MKQLNDYINLYLGCKVALAGGESYILKPSNLPNNWKSFSEPISGKLILRPLSDMTDEEMNYCVTKGQLVYRGESPKDFVVGWGAFSPEITRYLLSKSFDLFDLIPSGLAIDSTTLKTTLP